MEARGLIAERYLSPTGAFRKLPLINLSPAKSKPQTARNNRVTTAGQEVTWKLHGFQPDSWRVFATPLFAQGQPPKRIDVYVTDQSFAPGVGFLPDESAYNGILEALSDWCLKHPGFEKAYMEAPFASYLVVGSTIGRDGLGDIVLVPNYDVEQSWLSLQDLQHAWREHDIIWPDSIRLTDLKFEKQLQEAVTLVSFAGSKSSEGKGEDLTFVLKAGVGEMEHFYHELKMLLTLPSHPNIIGRPKYIVLADCKLGGKTGVCGFLIEYIKGGTLGDMLKSSSQEQSPSLLTKLDLALDIISAMMHIKDSPMMGFFSGLKPSNILMREGPSGLSPTIIDFEQLTGRAPWVPPEIHHVHVLEQIAVSDLKCSVAQESRALLKSYQPDWTLEPFQGVLSFTGATIAWRALGVMDREKAQVYMLGRVLWCLFEEEGSFSNGLDLEALMEPRCTKSFPTFEKTPLDLQDCIRQATAGAPEWRAHLPPIFIQHNRLCYRTTAGGSSEEILFSSPAALEAAAAWWRQEVDAATCFVQAMCRQKLEQAPLAGDGALLSLMTQRPTLAEVQQLLLAKKITCLGPVESDA